MRDTLRAHAAHFIGLKSAFLPKQAGKECYRNIARLRRFLESVAEVPFRLCLHRRGDFDFRNRLAANRVLCADRMFRRLGFIFLSNVSRGYRECASRRSLKTIAELETFEIDGHHCKRNKSRDEKSHL